MKRPTPAAKQCLQCEIARFGPWRVYESSCAECQIRMIANTDSGRRAPIYERIEAECGAKAAAAVKEKVGLEIVRQRLLRERAKV